MKIAELEQPIIGDIVEFETDPDTVVEGKIIGETEDGYIFEFSQSGYTELNETCTHGKYYCSTDKKWKCRQGPKQTRNVSEEDDKDPCWDGYHMVGMKNKGGKKVPNCVPEAANAAQQAAIAIAKKKKKETNEASGYIPRNSKEAKDPRWSSALTSDVTTHTMRDQIGNFFPTSAPNDGQQQVTEAEYQGRTVPLGKPMKGDVKKSKVYVRNDKGNVVKVNFGDPNMRIKKSSPKHRKSFRARHHCDNPGPRWKARYWSCKAW